MKELQKSVKEFCATYKLESPPEHHALDLMSELGEVAKEIVKMSSYGRQEFKMRDEVKEELGDALFSLTALANALNVDLEEELKNVLEKYKRRLSQGISAGSESENAVQNSQGREEASVKKEEEVEKVTEK